MHYYRNIGIFFYPLLSIFFPLFKHFQIDILDFIQTVVLVHTSTHKSLCF